MLKQRGNIRVIARLDIKGPNLIKGLQFEGNRVLGTAEFFARMYYQEGIDELFYQDAVASLYQRNGLLDIIQATSKSCFIPLVVAGGIRTLEDIQNVLRAGADKVAINTAAIERPNFLKEAVKIFGSQCIVSSIEAYRYHEKYWAWVNYGRERTQEDVYDWARRVEELGVGEILLSSINNDGLGKGYDIELTKRIATSASIPVITCCGAGTKQHVSDVVKKGMADAVAIASMFHYHYSRPVNQPTMSFDHHGLRLGEQVDSGNIEFLEQGYGGLKDLFVEQCSIIQLKQHMLENKIPVRIPRRTA